MDFIMRGTEQEDGGVKLSYETSWVEQKTYNLNKEEAKACIIPTFRGIETGILPPVIRYVSPSFRNIILERPPQVITLNYYGVLRNNVEEATLLQKFDIPLPWTIYAVSLTDEYQPLDIYVYAAKRSIRSASDRLYLLPITNCELDGKFCIPPISEEIYNTLGESINHAYSSVWSSNFNLDITENVEAAFDSRTPMPIFEGKGDRKVMDTSKLKVANFYKRWEEFTIDEVLNWNWYPAGYGGNDLNVNRLIGMLRDKENQLIDPLYVFNTIRMKVTELKSPVNYE